MAKIWPVVFSRTCAGLCAPGRLFSLRLIPSLFSPTSSSCRSSPPKLLAVDSKLRRWARREVADSEDTSRKSLAVELASASVSALIALPFTLLAFAPPPPLKKLSIGEKRVFVHDELAAVPSSLPEPDDDRRRGGLGDLELERERCGLVPRPSLASCVVARSFLALPAPRTVVG